MTEIPAAEDADPKDEKEPADFKISFSQAQALVDYLSSRPYRESANFIQMLVNLQKL